MVKNSSNIPHLTETASMSITAARTTDVSLLYSVNSSSWGSDWYGKLVIKIGKVLVDLQHYMLQKKDTRQKPQYSTITVSSLFYHSK